MQARQTLQGVGAIIVFLWALGVPQEGWAQGTIEAPEAASVQSGVVLIRGWHCTANVVELELDGGARFPAVYKLVRGDTQGVCGDVNNGFAVLINWNNIAEGLHTLVAYADGVEFGRVAFTVTSLGLGEFPTGLSGQFTVVDFPLPEQSVGIEWREAAQNFVLHSEGNNGTGGQQTAGGRLESPELGKVQSGVDLIRGWVCTANVVELELDGGARFQAIYKLVRGDTQGVCGDVDNGFAVLVNWNDVGEGLHTVRVFADGILLASAEFRVVTLGLGSFPQGLEKTEVLAGFPQGEQRVQVRWQESRQNFSLQGVLAPGQSANQCGSQSAQLQDGDGTTGSVAVTNPCTAQGNTVEWGIDGPTQFAAGLQHREARGQSTSLEVCVKDVVIEQGGQRFTVVDFRWVDGQGNEITTCREVEAGQTLPGFLVAREGSALNFNQPFQLTYRQTPVVTFSEVSPPRLTVRKEGSGGGTVKSDPVGISCGLDCAESYALGTTVTLSATSDAGSSFVGWSGDCSGTAVTARVPMTTDRSCTATFNPTPVPSTTYTLTVTKSGNGSGSVSSNPAGVSCGADCTEYPENTAVTLTAKADAGSSFGGWSGACSGSQPTVSVTMTADRSCSARFDPAVSPPPNYSLTMTKSGNGSGSVSRNPAGISCGADCTEYPENTVVTLTATADAGSTFSVWGGDGDCSDGTVTMTAAKTCTATFNLLPPSPPTISGISAGFPALNNCNTPGGTGSQVNVNFNYSDPNGDANQTAGATVRVDFRFSSGFSGSQDATPNSSFSRDGFNGQVTYRECVRFGTTSSIDFSFTLTDGAGNPSNSLTVTVPRPANAS